MAKIHINTPRFIVSAASLPGCWRGLRNCKARSLSYNNIADADAAWECVRSFDEIACVIVKHANPCGVAMGSSVGAAYAKAFKTDPTSAFGGIIAFNRAVDGDAARAIIPAICRSCNCA